MYGKVLQGSTFVLPALKLHFFPVCDTNAEYLSRVN